MAAGEDGVRGALAAKAAAKVLLSDIVLATVHGPNMAVDNVLVAK